MPFVPLDQTSEPPRGFSPLDPPSPSESSREFAPVNDQPKTGFVPLDSDSGGSRFSETVAPTVKTVKAIGQVYPVAETAANLITQAAALPVAGLAGLGAAATKAAGLSETEPADVVHSVAGALTFQPISESGKHLTQAAMTPFEWLVKAGTAAGESTLEATGSPVAATAVDTAINALPMAVGPLKKGTQAVREHIARNLNPEGMAAAPMAESTRGFVPLEATEHPGRLAPGRQEATNVTSPLSEPSRLPPESQEAPARGFPKGQAQMIAGRMTREGTPMEAYPHPSGDGTFAIRPTGGNQLTRTLEAPDDRIASETLPSGIRRLETNAAALPGSIGQGMEMVRREGNNRLPGMATELSEVSQGRGGEAVTQSFDLPGETGRQRQLRAGERGLVNDSASDSASALLSPDTLRRSDVDHSGGRAGIWRPEIDPARSSASATTPLGSSDPTGMAPLSQRFPIRDIERGNPERAGMGQALGGGADNATRAISAGDVPRASAAGGRPAPGEWASTIDPAAGPLSAAVHTGIGTGAVARLPVEAMSAGESVRNAFAPGDAYTGFVRDVPQPTAETAPATSVGRPQPIRREDILVQFAKDMGASLYEGRVKGENRLGFFRPKLEETRIKRHADIEVASHEMAHLLDDRVPAIKAAWLKDKALADELRSISYDAKKVNEGWAEGVRLWMTQPETLQARAPKVHAYLENLAATNERYGPAMRRAQEGMTNWFGQDALDRARSKIGDHAPLSDAFNGIFDRFRQSVSDDLHGVYRMERELSGGKLAPVGAYETARLSRASASIADGAVRFGHPVKKADGSFTYRGKGLQEIMAPAAERLDDALLYFVGRSARELMLQGREHLFSPGEINGMLGLETPEFRKAFAEYQAWNKGILDFAEAQGVLNPETRALWKRTEYLPFHRVSQPGGMKGKPGDWAGIQQLTGGTENIKDVLGNMIGNAAMLIDKAVKNEARLKVAELASRPGGGRFMAKIDAGSRPIKIGGDQVLEAMFKKYGVGIQGEAPAFFEFMLHGQPPAGGNVVAVLKGGKPVWYEVADPILYRALTALDRPPMDWLTRMIGTPKRIGQMTITLTPDFMAANIARDTLMAAVMSRSGFRPVIDSLQGMRLRMTEDPLYRDYIANGGGLSSLFLDEHHFRTKLEKFYTRQGIDYRTVLDTPDKILSFLETLGDAFEMSTRLGEYGRAIDKGEHPRHAAYLGREVSTDFAMRGDNKALGFMYDTVMFLRPAVVSMDRLFRGVAHDSNKSAIAMKTAMIALSSVGLYLLNRDDPRYQALNAWERDSAWHFFVGDQHFHYPRIWEVGSVASLAERSVEKLIESDPQGLGKDFIRIIGNTFNLNFKPQIIAPLYEQATNRNSFTESPIETAGMEDLQPFLRAKPGTSETMKALGMATRNLPESLQINPVRTEALLRGYLNTWAMYGLMLSDRAFFGDKLPAMRADQMPVIRRFYSQEPPLHTTFETQFYDMLGEANRLHGTLRELDRIGRPEIADEKERSPMASEAKPLGRAAKNLAAINKEIFAITRSNLSPEEKRRQHDLLFAERNALLKATVQDAKAAQRR